MLKSDRGDIFENIWPLIQDARYRVEFMMPIDDISNYWHLTPVDFNTLSSLACDILSWYYDRKWGQILSDFDNDKNNNDLMKILDNAIFIAK